jgi:hypothetical protein
VITRIVAAPHPDNQVQVTFEAVDVIKDAAVGAAIMEKREGLASELRQPYQPKEDEPAKKPAKPAGKAKRKF